MPADPLKVYDLGQQGVQLVASPLHQEPAKEVIRAQNAIYDKDSRAGGLRKRGGLAKLNSVALNSGATIAGALYVAFADPASPLTIGTRRGLYLRDVNAGGTLYTDSPSDFAGPVELAASTPFPSVQLSVGVPINSGDEFAVFSVAFPGRVYFVAQQTYPEIWRWDGLAASKVLRLPAPPQDHADAGSHTDCDIVGVYLFDGDIYIATLDGDSGAAPFEFGRVFKFDPDTEGVEQVGLSTWGKHSGALAQGFPAALEWFGGRLWAATATATAAIAPKVFSIRPGVDEDWTLEETGTAGHHFTGLKVYRGELYATTAHATAGTASLIRKRTTDGTWSTVRTNASTAATNGYGGMAVINDLLLVVERDNTDGAGGDDPLILSYNGSVFTTRVDVRADHPPGAAGSTYGVGAPLEYDGAVYYPLRDSSTAGSRILRTTNGTAFSLVFDTVGDPGPPNNYHAIFGALRD